MTASPVLGQPIYPHEFTNYEGYIDNNSAMSPMYYNPNRQTFVVVEDRVIIRRRRRNALIIILIFCVVFITFFSVFWFY